MADKLQDKVAIVIGIGQVSREMDLPANTVFLEGFIIGGALGPLGVASGAVFPWTWCLK